jgi:ribosomal protein S18 acetylase RimI-like enzyme
MSFSREELDKLESKPSAQSIVAGQSSSTTDPSNSASKLASFARLYSLKDPSIVMPRDPAVILASAIETTNLINVAQEDLINSILKEQAFNVTDTDDARKHVKDSLTKIWDENVEILSMARLARYRCHVGIFYTPPINRTVEITGRFLVNLEEFFNPGNVSFLNQYGKNAAFKVTSLLDLNLKYFEDFDFSDAIIFLPICYTARHGISGEKFFDIMKYFVFEKKCSIMVYLRGDAAIEDDDKLKELWLSQNECYVQQIKNMKDSFWDENEKIYVKIVHRQEMIKTPQYLYAEHYFARYRANDNVIIATIKQDVINQLIQKKYITPPGKATSKKPRQTKTVTPVPIPVTLGPEKKFERQMVAMVLDCDSDESMDFLVRRTRERIDLINSRKVPLTFFGQQPAENIIIRFAHFKDVEKVVAVARKAHDETFGVSETFNKLLDIRFGKTFVDETYKQELLSDDVMYFVAKVNKKMVGFAKVIFDDGTKSAVLDKLYVLQDYQRQKIGTQLLHQCFERVIARGITNMNLHVNAGNERAISFYEKCGFARTGIIESTIKDSDFDKTDELMVCENVITANIRLMPEDKSAPEPAPAPSRSLSPGGS